jgi:hypothetical protein
MFISYGRTSRESKGVEGSCKLSWTKSGMIGVHFCIVVFYVIKNFTINMSTKNLFFARTIYFLPFLIHYWILWMKKIPSNSKKINIENGILNYGAFKST